MSEKRYPKLATYYNRLKNRPSIKATWPKTWLENPKGSEQMKDIWAAKTPEPLFYPNTPDTALLCNDFVNIPNGSLLTSL